MGTKITQKDFRFNKKEFSITENGLEIKEKNLFSSTEYTVVYDNIGIRPFKVNKGIVEILLACLGLIAVVVIMLVSRNSGEQIETSSIALFCGLSLVFLFAYFFTYKRSHFLVHPGNINGIEFLQNKPSAEELNSFIEEVKIKRNEVLYIKYGHINTSIQYEQNYKNILWLFNNDVINKTDYENKLQELDQKFNRQNDSRIGFNIAGS